MSSSDGKQLLENVPAVGSRSVLPEESDAAVDARKQPVGTVERILNFQERSLLVAAGKIYCYKKEQEKGDYKAQAKLSKLIKVLFHEETVDYFDMIDDSIEEKLFRWQRARNDWLLVQQYAAGGITLEELKKKSPLLDIQNPPEKPSRRQPEATTEEIRGRERSFYLPSKLDSWAQDVLRGVNWPNPEKAQYITELCEKFGIKSDEG